VISGAQVFDGEDALGRVDVHVEDGLVTAVGGADHEGAQVVDGADTTLLPGLIDSHTHAVDDQSLRQAILFGVTTEFDMGGVPELVVPLRSRAAADTQMADVRTALIPLTPPGGHPNQVRVNPDYPPWPTVAAAVDVPRFVSDRIAEGCDYVKVIVEDGGALGLPVPVLHEDMQEAAVAAGHEQGRMVVAHALAVQAAASAVRAGVDGLTHVWLDRPHSPELVPAIASRDVFVIPTMATLASLAGVPVGAELAADERVHPHLSGPILENLGGSWSTLSQEHLDYALAGVAALREAGVDVLAGTDARSASIPSTRSSGSTTAPESPPADSR